MQITNGTKYRLHPDEQQAKVLSQWIGCQRFIYNAKVGEDRYFRTFSRKSLMHAGMLVPVDQKYSQFVSEETAFLRDVPSQILRNGAYRWMTAYQRFFKGLAGRPKTKGKDGRQSAMVTSELFTINILKDEVTLGTGKHPVGTISYTRHGERRPVPKSICIARHAGKWWISFSYDELHPDEAEPLSERELIGLFQAMPKEELAALTTGSDRGVAIPVAGSGQVNFDFDPITKARMQKKEHLRRRYQRKLTRQQDGSKRKARTKLRIDRTYAYQANSRHDFAHKTSRKLVDSEARVFVFENLKIQNMTRKPKAKQDPVTGKFMKNGARAKAGLNRAILGSGWGKTVQFTTYKGLRKNKLTIKIKPNGTSQECSLCGHTHPDNRETQSEFVCQRCGFTANADYNASLNIKRRGVEALCSGAYAEKQKKTVRFRKTASARDGTPKVKRASHEGAAGSEKPITAAQETTVRRRRAKPAGAGAYESRNPHYNEAVPSAAQFSGG